MHYQPDLEDTHVDINAIRQIKMGERLLQVVLTKRAQSALERVDQPVHFEMELYFSCLIRKRVNVLSTPRKEHSLINLNNLVSISFRPVMTRHCRVSDIVDEPDVIDFPLQHDSRIAPRWLSLDYSRGTWRGDFGFTPLVH